MNTTASASRNLHAALRCEWGKADAEAAGSAAGTGARNLPAAVLPQWVPSPRQPERPRGSLRSKDSVAGP